MEISLHARNLLNNYDLNKNVKRVENDIICKNNRQDLKDILLSVGDTYLNSVENNIKQEYINVVNEYIDTLKIEGNNGWFLKNKINDIINKNRNYYK